MSDWRTMAACHGQSRIFFSTSKRDKKKAKQICDSCVVIEQCKSDALTDETTLGTRAGTYYKPKVLISAGMNVLPNHDNTVDEWRITSDALSQHELVNCTPVDLCSFDSFAGEPYWHSVTPDGHWYLTA